METEKGAQAGYEAGTPATAVPAYSTPNPAMVAPPAQMQQPVAVPQASPQNMSIAASETWTAIDEARNGLTEAVSGRISKHEDALAKDLLPGEQILETFDVFYNARFMPRWKFVLLCILSFGLFFIYYHLREACYRMRCCTPAIVELLQGRMAITNMGRALVWHQYGAQVKAVSCPCLGTLFRCITCGCFCCKETCAPPVVYEVRTEVKTFLLKDVMQVTQTASNVPYIWCLPCCCHDLQSYVKLTFSGFDNSTALDLQSDLTPVASVSSSPGTANNFLLVIGSFLLEVGNAAVSLGVIPFGLYTEHNPAIYVLSVSEPRDLVHMAKGKDAGTTNTVIEESSNLHATVISMLPQRRVIFDPVSEDVLPMPQVHEGLSGVQVVADDGTVQLPSRLIPLFAGESIIGAAGVVGLLSILDWILIILTAGLWYCFRAREKRFMREALVLTTHRIISVTVHQRAGEIPTHYGAMAFAVRSYVPTDAAKSGYIVRDKKSGACGAKFGEAALFFTAEFSGMGANRLMDNFIGFGHALSRTVERTQNPVGLANTENMDAELDDAKRSMLPLLPSETVLARVSGRNYWESFCLGLCSKQSCGICFPWLPFLACCTIRPFRLESDILLTNHSIFGVYHRACCVGCLKSDKQYVVFWTSVRSMMGSRTAFSVEGKESWMRRLCTSCPCSICCPMASSVFEANVVNEDGVEATVIGWQRDGDYSQDPDIDKFRTALGTIASVVSAEDSAA